MLDFIHMFTFLDLLDIALVAIILYTFFYWFKQTKAAFVLIGFFLSGAAYLLFKIFNFKLAAFLLQGFFAVVILAFIIIFQEEIRRSFEKIASLSLKGKFKNKVIPDNIRQTQIITKTVFDLAKKNVGALIVLSSKDILERYLNGGIELDGVLSEPLLKSIFDPHSIGHDGAVVVEDGRVLRFACKLPLSKESEKLKDRGLRHSAALGLAELTDALCIAVSEERGTVAVCRYGKIEVIEDENKLITMLGEVGSGIIEVDRHLTLRKLFMANVKEKLIAVFFAFALWFIFIYGSKLTYKSFDLPVSYIGLEGKSKDIESIPSKVKVVVSGQRKDFYFISSKNIELSLKIFNFSDFKKTDNNYYEIPVTASDIDIPSGVSVVNIVPRTVNLRLNKFENN